MDLEQKKRIAEIIHASDANNLCPTINEQLCALLDEQDPNHKKLIGQIRAAAQGLINQNQHQPHLKGIVLTDADLKTVYVQLAAGLQLAYEQAPWRETPALHLGYAPQGLPGFCFVSAHPQSALIFGIQGVIDSVVRKRNNYTHDVPLNGMKVTPDIFPVRTGVEEGRHIAQHYNPELKGRMATEEKRAYPHGRPAQISHQQYPNDPKEVDVNNFITSNKDSILRLSESLKAELGKGRV